MFKLKRSWAENHIHMHSCIFYFLTVNFTHIHGSKTQPKEYKKLINEILINTQNSQMQCNGYGLTTKWKIAGYQYNTSKSKQIETLHNSSAWALFYNIWVQLSNYSKLQVQARYSNIYLSWSIRLFYGQPILI